jgi:hypothetical protein
VRPFFTWTAVVAFLTIPFRPAIFTPSCDIQGPHFAKRSTEDKFKDMVFVKVDVDDNEETSEECGISAMPTFQVGHRIVFGPL